jgi:hypothetical protein
VLENVEGASLINPVTLCGSMFGLRAEFPGHGTVGLRRHRLFESSAPLTAPGPCRHGLPALRVFGHGRAGNSDLSGPGYAQASRDAMGIWWMTRDQLNEAIPPAYAEHVGLQLMAALTRAGAGRMSTGGGRRSAPCISTRVPPFPERTAVQDGWPIHRVGCGSRRAPGGARDRPGRPPHPGAAAAGRFVAAGGCPARHLCGRTAAQAAWRRPQVPDPSDGT